MPTIANLNSVRSRPAISIVNISVLSDAHESDALGLRVLILRRPLQGFVFLHCRGAQRPGCLGGSIGKLGKKLLHEGAPPTAGRIDRSRHAGTVSSSAFDRGFGCVHPQLRPCSESFAKIANTSPRVATTIARSTRKSVMDEAVVIVRPWRHRLPSWSKSGSANAPLPGAD